MSCGDDDQDRGPIVTADGGNTNRDAGARDAATGGSADGGTTTDGGASDGGI